ncbi:UTRA domain-containing protein [Cupriavidus basilensis]
MPRKSPLRWSTSVVDHAYSGLPELGEVLSAPVYTMIEKAYGIKVTRVEQELQGYLVTGTQAECLRVEDRSAGLRIIRTYFLRDKVIAVTTGIHPASRFSYLDELPADPGTPGKRRTSGRPPSDHAARAASIRPHVVRDPVGQHPLNIFATRSIQ